MDQGSGPYRIVVPSIDPRIADGAAALIFTAIGELAEEASEAAKPVQADGRTIWTMQANTLQTFGRDVAVLAEALEVLGRRRGIPDVGHD